MSRPRLKGLLGLAVAFALVGAPAASADTTTFKGRFVCVDPVDPAVQLPLAGARVELFGQALATSFGGFDLDPAAALVDGFASTLNKQDKFVLAGSGVTGPDGEWSFNVNQTAPKLAFRVAVFLDDGAGTTVSHYPDSGPAGAQTGDNLNDTAVQDYHTQPFNGAECSVWLGLERAVANYRQITGSDLPYGSLNVQYGVPGLVVPFTDYTTINWPTGYPPGPQPGSQVAVAHEFWHTIRNFSLGSRNAFLNEVSGLGARGSDPCVRTSPQGAFNEGWPEFWARDFAPAPVCPGVSTGDTAVEGMVAWTLTEMEAGCPADGRRRMVQVMLAHGASIHTLDDFRRYLGCQGVPLDLAKVPRYGISPRALAGRWIPAARLALAGARRNASRLSALLPEAQRKARRDCPQAPCTRVIAAKIVPPLLLGQIKEERMLIQGLEFELKPRQISQENGRITRTLLNQLHATPPSLKSALARIGELSFKQALSVAAPLARHDHSSGTRRLLGALRADRADFAAARRRGGLLPGAFPLGGASPGRTRRVPATGVVSFAGIPDGTVVTAQTAALGATFGSAQSLGFPGTPGYPTGSYVCPAGPTVQGGVAVAPACPGGPSGFQSTGTMARLSSPAQSVSVRVGATQATPGGSAAYVYAFDAAGKPVIQNAALVGASSQGQGTGLAKTVRLDAGHGQSITYVALFFAAYGSPIPRLEFNNLTYTGP